MGKPGKFHLFIVFGAIILHQGIHAQYIRNPSLEGPVGDWPPPIYWNTDDEWSDPNLYNVYYTYEQNTEYRPVDGNIFLLFRARGVNYAETWHGPRQREYLYQKLAKPLEKHTCFRFEVFLATNSDYQVNDSEDPHVGYPLKFNLYGGNGPQSREKLLIESEAISNDTWEKFTFFFFTDDNEYSYILIEPAWDTVNIKPEPYNGMFLIDNMALENAGQLDTINEHTVYYRGEGETQLFAANGLSFTWSPNEMLFPPDAQLPIMLDYHDIFHVYIERGGQCPSVELFNVILNCDTLYQDTRERYKEFYYKYDTLAQLVASEGVSWNWEPQVDLTDYNIRAPRMTDYRDTYSVTIMDKYDCIFIDSFHIILHCDTLYPEETFVVLDTLVAQDATIPLVPKYGTIEGLWTPSLFLDCVDCQIPLATPRNSTTYTVDLNDEYGCLHTETFILNVNFFVPNVITPNEDGFNDCLKIFGLPDNTSFTIYNKNGIMLYYIDPYPQDFCWKGVDQYGETLKAGTYWYALEHPAEGILKKGFVLIKR